MKSIMLLATIGVLTLAHPAKTLAADTTKFVIDPPTAMSTRTLLMAG